MADTFDPHVWLDPEYADCAFPPHGLGQWHLHFMEDVLHSDISNGKLLNLYCMAYDKYLDSAHVFGDYYGRVTSLLLSRMSGKQIEPGNDPAALEADIGFEPEAYMDAIGRLCTCDLTDAELLCLYDLATSLRGDDDYGPQWQSVMDLCRASILKRITSHYHDDGRAQQTEDSGDTDNDNLNDIGDHIDRAIALRLSMRNHLRRAESAYYPSMPNERLISLYFYTLNFAYDQAAFDDIMVDIKDRLLARMSGSGGNPKTRRKFRGYDPEEYRLAAEAVCSGELPHKRLLVLGSVARSNSGDKGEQGQWWRAIKDMALAQILARTRENFNSGEVPRLPPLIADDDEQRDPLSTDQKAAKQPTHETHNLQRSSPGVQRPLASGPGSECRPDDPMWRHYSR